MARKVIWSYEATTDLDALTEYIARDSTFYAASFVQEILTASRSLDRFSDSPLKIHSNEVEQVIDKTA